ncbi:MAG: ComF family protein [Pseudomonadota bacterium]|nr:ComF family protein [Pseudomonadota bacterium]
MHWLEKWLLPPRCVITGVSTQQGDLSEDLIQEWTRPKAVCPQCCELSANDQVCGACLSKPPAFNQTQVGFYFDKELVDLIHGLKYQNRLAYARILGECLAERVQPGLVEAIIAVPLHPKRFRDRGYNQAELIAESVAKALAIPFIKHSVKRIKDTPSQTHLNSGQRRKNLKRAFEVVPEKLTGLSHIAIVDDVITTGATMQSLAETIKLDTGIKTIQAWSIAKTK